MQNNVTIFLGVNGLWLSLGGIETFEEPVYGEFIKSSANSLFGAL
jgi:hypothetical protein